MVEEEPAMLMASFQGGRESGRCMIFRCRREAGSEAEFQALRVSSSGRVGGSRCRQEAEAEAAAAAAAGVRPPRGGGRGGRGGRAKAELMIKRERAWP